jgi:hypothetical protein
MYVASDNTDKTGMLLQTILTRQNYDASVVIDTKQEPSLVQDSISAEE